MYSDGKSDSIVIGIDFPITGRGEAGFVDLAPLIGDTFGLWETMPSMDLTGEVSGAAYVADWLAELKRSGKHIRGILSFCAGAAFVPAVARGIRQWQQEVPTVILVDPEIPVPMTLHMQFQRALERFAPLLSEAERQSAFGTADRLYQENSHDITALQAAISKVFQEIGHIGFERAGIDPRHGAELLVAFDAFARYLVAGAQVRAAAGPVDEERKPIAISSNTPTNGLNLVSEEQRAALVAKEIRFEIPHATLLSSPEVARTIVELLS
ncbi:hypothetical protein [Micromonospora echinofusca]|uniref:Uncharacterized protein n=1 Tax=Micromonospora echinofusca TaxID=47858 RepID=A0ABS3VSM4_MICEH|nr:hypothetical protein [Micromonospora echinofusca]MBO4207363.1 hypothetical protein [Micromonospora echinofusca]